MPIKGKNLFKLIGKMNLLHDNRQHQLEYFKPELFLFYMLLRIPEDGSSIAPSLFKVK